MVRRYPSILLPFFIKAIFEGIALTVLFYFPRPPFSIIFAQPVKNIFGASFLHYPYNFNLLPTLFYYGQIFIMLTLGAVMYGMAMGMVSQAHSGNEDVRIFGNFNRAVRRYFALTGVWLITFILSLVILKVPPIIIKKLMQPSHFAVLLLQTAVYLGIALIYLVETLFVYAYPAIVIERKGFFSAIGRSFGVIRHVFLTTIVLIAVPRLFEFLYTFVRQKQQGLMNLTVPEITLVILGVSIAVSFIADSAVFLSTANLFILKQETEKSD